MDKNEVIEILKRYIAFLKRNKYSITTAYLFGSVAKGNSNEDSDIDIAVVINGLKDSFSSQVELMKMRRNFDVRIEPHLFNASEFNSSNPFIQNIINTGIKII